MSKRVLVRAALAVGAATLSITAAVMPPASAAPLPITNWTANVTTHVTAINQDITIPPSTFSGSVETTTGAMTGSLNLQPSTFTYNVFFFIPTEITMNVDPVGTNPVSGTVNFQNNTVTANATFDVRLSSVKLFGLELLDAAQTCKTTTPTVASLTGTVNLAATPANVHLSGTYDIAALQGCGFWGGLISGFTAGVGNTLDVQITAPA